MTLPVITAGEPEPGAWCPVCLEPWRLRIPLFLNGELSTVLEICPGCGTGHDKSAAYTVPVTHGPEPEPLPPSRRQRLAASIRERLRPADERDQCGYGTCPRRASDRHCHVLAYDEGRMTFRFCGERHRRAWLTLNDIA